jgi:hypothetical protein
VIGTTRYLNNYCATVTVTGQNHVEGEAFQELAVENTLAHRDEIFEFSQHHGIQLGLHVIG